MLAAEAETPLERQLSQVIMHGGLGPAPKPAKVKGGTTIITEGEAARTRSERDGLGSEIACHANRRGIRW